MQLHGLAECDEVEASVSKSFFFIKYRTKIPRDPLQLLVPWASFMLIHVEHPRLNKNILVLVDLLSIKDGMERTRET